MRKAKGAKGKCDSLFSKIIRRQGYCDNCGKRENLQCAHIISRRYSATRTDERNAVCLCAKCHIYYTHWPREFSKFITDRIGSELYEELKAKAEQITKMDWNEELERLKKVAKKYGL